MPTKLEGAIAAIAALSCVAGCSSPVWPSREDMTQSQPHASELAPAEAVYAAAAPSVVQVLRSRSDEAGLHQDLGLGSGFVWDDSGHIVTNSHVAGRAGVTVIWPDGGFSDAVVVGKAPHYDIAVLRVAHQRGVAPRPRGRTEDLKVGQALYAIGYPFGLGESLTHGVVSAVRQRMASMDGLEVLEVVQTDAPLNPGNSGGPLLNEQGEAIGLATSIYTLSGTTSGVGFATPIELVSRVADQLIATGHAPVPGIGILVAGDDVTAKFGVRGVLVADVAHGSSAQKAGLLGMDPQGERMGDIVLAADRIPVRTMADLSREFARAGLGAKVTLTIDRGGKQFAVDVTVEDLGLIG